MPSVAKESALSGCIAAVTSHAVKNNGCATAGTSQRATASWPNHMAAASKTPVPRLHAHATDATRRIGRNSPAPRK